MTSATLPRTALALLAVAAAACASTQLRQSWVKPDIGALSFRKVTAMAVTPNPTRRRLMEDAMVSEIRRVAPSVDVTPSYTFAEDLQNTEATRAAFEQHGFDGVVALRITDVTRTDVWVPGRTVVVPVTYRTFWGWYTYWVPISHSPGFVERNQNVQVETEVYALGVTGDGDLVYSAVSTTLNPTSSADLVQGVGRVVARDMRDKGLIR